MRRFIYIALLTAFFSACARISLKSRVYVGEVVAVRAVEGEHFTRAKGAVSLTFLIVRIKRWVELRAGAAYCDGYLHRSSLRYRGRQNFVPLLRAPTI